jgi:hypothetical protein
MLGTVLVTFGGTLIGFVLSVFVFESDRPLVAGLLGTGGGTMIGAYIAAIATNEPLLGRGSSPPSTPRRSSRDEDEDDGR